MLHYQEVLLVFFFFKEYLSKYYVSLKIIFKNGIIGLNIIILWIFLLLFQFISTLFSITSVILELEFIENIGDVTLFITFQLVNTVLTTILPYPMKSGKDFDPRDIWDTIFVNVRNLFILYIFESFVYMLMESIVYNFWPYYYIVMILFILVTIGRLKYL